jgi:hypothetical protein
MEPSSTGNKNRENVQILPTIAFKAINIRGDEYNSDCPINAAIPWIRP